MLFKRTGEIRNLNTRAIEYLSNQTPEEKKDITKKDIRKKGIQIENRILNNQQQSDKINLLHFSLFRI